ncbi:MAG TPA: tetratricopeptide repeat protein [Candidatus Acidoferrales bacterium]|nr:tetratricopeptide repeat protein [Candidatus Acidoferrales bacterium]
MKGYVGQVANLRFVGQVDNLRRIGNPPAAILISAAFLIALTLPAQTLDQAESLWKARRYQEANEVFKQLVAQHPENADYKVRWGRLYLDHWQPKIAADLFNEALAIKKDHAGAFLGMALVAADGYESRAADLANKALESDPKLLEAQELLARLALEDNTPSKAAAEAKKALEIDPNAVQAKAILASIDWLADKKETTWDPHTARGYETVGHFFVINRRYLEGIQYYRKAIELDPTLYSARSQLGINLMRQGQEEEAYKQLETCFTNGFQDDATKNSLVLMDSYKNFVTFKTDNTVLKLHKKEAELLHPYFESEMQRAIATYEKKYKLKLEQPVQVEVYPDHEDFAVRTMGMPGLGALGVTFGYSIAMDSPSGRKPGSFHWASTLWHEMSHVYTLTATGHKVPRWFTEGLAVHEETAISPDWGDRLSPDVIAAIKGKKLLPIMELDRGFIHPVSPPQVIVSYFQGGRICDFIDEKWGWDTLLAMLHDFGAGENTYTVVTKELKIEPDEFDRRFLEYIDASTKNVVEHFDEWKKGLKKVVELAAAKDYDGVIKEGTPIRDMYPDYVEEHSVYEELAHAYIAKGNKPAAVAELERYAKIGGREPESLKLLAKELVAAGRKKDAADVLNRLNFVYPMDTDAHRTLGGLWLEQGNFPGAIREYRAVLAHVPVQDPAQSHYDLARAYHANHQPDQANEEVLAALEAAPGFRPAQKLLLELSTTAEKPIGEKK